VFDQEGPGRIGKVKPPCYNTRDFWGIPGEKKKERKGCQRDMDWKCQLGIIVPSWNTCTGASFVKTGIDQEMI
jgi:hypothetical protein